MIDKDVTACKEVRRLSSSSLGVLLTKEFKLAGIGEGDLVEVSVRKVKEARR